MSTIYKHCGISLKVNEFNENTPKKEIINYINDKQNIFSDDNINIKNEDDLYEYLNDEKLNIWKLYYDTFGNYGWKYLTDVSESCDDLDFSINLLRIEELSEVLCNITNIPHHRSEIKIFAFEWYSGCDNPFKF